MMDSCARREKGRVRTERPGFRPPAARRKPTPRPGQDDEFISKANVLSVHGVVVARVHPWRNDCRRFRERSPYRARWSDGNWPSDYSRSGWCPGVEVLPVEFDLTDHLEAGRHTIRLVIGEIRPEDAQGHFGYWRVSASLIGWDRPPRPWMN